MHVSVHIHTLRILRRGVIRKTIHPVLFRGWLPFISIGTCTESYDKVLDSSKSQANLWLQALGAADAIVRIFQEVKERLSDLFRQMPSNEFLQRNTSTTFELSLFSVLANVYTIFRCTVTAYAPSLTEILLFDFKKSSRTEQVEMIFLFGSGRAVCQCSVGCCLSNKSKGVFNCSHLP